MNEHLSELLLDIVDNWNNNITGINHDGLHLNETGMGKLAVKLKRIIIKVLKDDDR